jgi:hypothetical protein
MPGAKVSVALERRRLAFFGKISRELFAGTTGRRRRACAGGDKLVNFATKPDFGHFGEFALVRITACVAVSCYCNSVCGNSTALQTRPTFTTASRLDGGWRIAV